MTVITTPPISTNTAANRVAGVWAPFQPTATVEVTVAWLATVMHAVNDATTLAAQLAQVEAILARADAPGAPACRDSLRAIRLVVDPTPAGLVERVSAAVEVEG